MSAALRRLLAALTLLSVLLGAGGSAHPACAADRGAGGGVPRAGSMVLAMDMAHATHASHDRSATTSGADGAHRARDAAGGSGADDRRDHPGAPPAGCATLAHCVFAPPAVPAAVALGRTVDGVGGPRAARETPPRGPALEPESPPPRA